VFAINSYLWPAAFIRSPSRFTTSQSFNPCVLVSSPISVDNTCFHACSAYSFRKMEAICSSETSVDFQRTTRRYIPDDSTIRLLFCLQEPATGPYPAPDESPFTPSQPMFSRCILIVSFHLRLGPSSGLLPSGFRTKTSHALLSHVSPRHPKWEDWRAPPPPLPYRSGQCGQQKNHSHLPGKSP
jgi:hypothetical protein